MSVLALSLKYNVSRGVIDDRLRKAKIKKRSASAQHVIRNANYTPEQRLAHACAAHNAVRGSQKSTASLVQAALARQAKAVMTEKERQWHDALLTANIKTIPQYAFKRYNIDLAIPDAKIALEIENGWSVWGHKKVTRELKTKALKRAGWLVISINKKVYCSKQANFANTQHAKIVEAIKIRMKRLKHLAQLHKGN